MNKLNDILHELGISKVKLAKYLGVSRQMIYNYLELDDISKWPKDKKVLLLNLLGVKSADEIDKIKVDTDYIMNVEARINSLFDNNSKSEFNDNPGIYNGLAKKQKELLHNIVELIKEKLEDEKDEDAYVTYRYLYHFIQSLDSSRELKYMLGYVVKASGFIKPMEFAFNEEEQFIFESIMFSGMTLYNSAVEDKGSISKTKIAECHKRFVKQIEQRMEEKMGRTLELKMYKEQALKELGYTEINNENSAEVLEKIVEIESRGV